VSKKITLSISEELSEKMDKWKDSFNFSKVFQDAMSEAIQKKEDFQARLKGSASMEEIIERLKKERAEVAVDYKEKGKADGLAWAKAASYEDLYYAAEGKGALFSWDPDERSSDMIFNDHSREVGNYWNNMILNDACMGWVAVEDDPDERADVPNEFLSAWFDGWFEAVEAFWSEIKDKLSEE